MMHHFSMPCVAHYRSYFQAPGSISIGINLRHLAGQLEGSRPHDSKSLFFNTPLHLFTPESNRCPPLSACWHESCLCRQLPQVVWLSQPGLEYETLDNLSSSSIQPRSNSRRGTCPFDVTAGKHGTSSRSPKTPGDESPTLLLRDYANKSLEHSADVKAGH